MKASEAAAIVLSLVLVLLSCAGVYAQPAESGDRTLSPYFFVKSDDPGVDALPLKSTAAAVRISGVIADVKVTQRYKNEGRAPIEAIYIFPASTRAAVYGMKMTIGQRVIEAKIRKKDEARREYEQARQQGRSASLLEQKRPNVFQMNVANIMPGDEISVELRYTELLVPEDKIYEFVYPTVVGPRYSNSVSGQAGPERAAAAERWVKNPYLHQGELPGYSFDIKVNIEAGLPVSDIRCPSHKVDVSYDGPSAAGVRLDKTERNGGNRDYVLRYRLAGEKIQSGLLLYKGKKENFFLLMMQPPKRVSPAQIPGREYIFIVDVSGSMHGFPLDISKKLIKDLIGGLRPSDRFNVLLFSGGNSVMSEQSLPATEGNIRKAIDLIERQQGGGGTELLPALKRALSLPGAEAYSRSVLIVTDGYVTVEEEAFDLVRNNLGKANMFSFGIGTSVNRHLIEGMARVGMGEPFVITKPEEAAAKAEAFRKMIVSPVLTRIKVDFGNFDVYDIEPSHIPDVFADRPVIVVGKWRGRPRGRITMSGVSGSGVYSYTVATGKIGAANENSAIRYLWARHRVGVLSDYNALRLDTGRIEEVTALGLNYNLLTAYTSFVAVDSEVRNKDGISTVVKQPLPLPEGVSDLAVGQAAANFAPAAPTARGAATAAMKLKEEVKKDSPAEAIDGVNIIRIAVSDPQFRTQVEKEILRHSEKIRLCYSNGLGQAGRHIPHIPGGLRTESGC